MAEIQIKAGATVDIMTPGEAADAMHRAWNEALEAQLRERVRGIKWMRLPVMQATPSGGKVTLSDSTNPPCGPEQGYAWSVRRIVIDGLTTGATPDVINMYRNFSTGQAPLWQFNGNNFGYTFGPLELVLISGDTIKYESVGTFSATGLIRATGEVVEVPAEMLAKLAF